MKPLPQKTDPDASVWPHRLAVLLVCVTFPLIWVGGLVTTYDAGMAVPDWPSTYGYNLFLYPWQTWISGPWDLFVEHGHRLLGALAGLVTIGLVIATFRGESRGWVRMASLAALALVIGQGVLGGMRVRLDHRTLAMIHGCVGPAFFGFAVALSVFTSRYWRESREQDPSPQNLSLARLALMTTFLIVMQLVVGANLRHIQPFTSHSLFRVIVIVHLFVAAVIGAHALLLVFAARATDRRHAALRRPAYLLAGLIACQIGLGIATWVVNYSWPTWLELTPALAGYTITAKSLFQSNIVTAHVALGSLVLAVSVQLAVRCCRQAGVRVTHTTKRFKSLLELAP